MLLNSLVTNCVLKKSGENFEKWIYPFELPLRLINEKYL